MLSLNLGHTHTHTHKKDPKKTHQGALEFPMN